jgi:L-threonylcarbamoyladenylate synthase
MRVLAVDPENPDPGAVREAARALREGALVAFPTETVYGLGARVFDERAVARIFAAKGRPASHPLIAHVSGEQDAAELAAGWSARASRLAQAFWPGPLTLVVDRAATVPPAVSGGGDSIAVRAPAHPVARALLDALGEPIAAPSANRYQSLSPTTAEHVRRSLGEAVAFILDAGPCPAGIESTVLDVRGDRPRVLRPGAIDLPTLRRVEPLVVMGAVELPAVAGRASPGMDARHYAPRARLVLARDRQGAVCTARAQADAGARVGLVLRGASESLPGLAVETLPDDPARYAARLYATLHALDEAGVTVLVVEAVPDDERWLAVADRLRRGAARA